MFLIQNRCIQYDPIDVCGKNTELIIFLEYLITICYDEKEIL